MIGVAEIGTDLWWNHSLNLKDTVNPSINKKLYEDIFDSASGYGIFYSLRVLCIQQYLAINTINKIQNQWQNIKNISIKYGKQYINFASSKNTIFSKQYQRLVTPNKYKLDINLTATKRSNHDTYTISMRVPAQESNISVSDNFFSYNYSYAVCVANVYTFTAIIEDPHMHKKYKVQIFYKKDNEFRIKNISINESDYNKFGKMFNENGNTEKIFGDTFDRQIKNLVYCYNRARAEAIS